MKDMTRGSIFILLIKYAIPMILGNILQLTYNAADSIIIGKFLGEKALAAVSTSNPVMTIMVLGASGIGIGASVIMSRFYGAKDFINLKREFSTTVILGTILSFIIFIPGFLCSTDILTLINTPAESLGMAATYLRIIFIGFLFTFQYNILSHSIRSTGDSRTPVVFLGLSCILNICLDLLFIAVMNMGVGGAALATAISEAVSVILCIRYIYTRIPELRLKKKDFAVDKALLGETLGNGFLTALQQAAQPVGKVLIQSVVNLQGIAAIDAFNAVCRVDDFACIPSQSIGNAVMTCTAQNVGAQNEKRVRKTFRNGLAVALCYFPIICSLTLIFRTPVMKLFSPRGSSLIISMGVSYLTVKAWFFIMPCITNSIQGYFRGLGHMAIVLFATIIQISIRTLCVYLWVPEIGITGEAYACFAGWSCQIIFETACLAILALAGKKQRKTVQ